MPSYYQIWAAQRLGVPEEDIVYIEVEQNRPYREPSEESTSVSIYLANGECYEGWADFAMSLASMIDDGSASEMPLVKV